MSEITQADWMLAANVMGFDSTEALRRHGHLRALHKQWAERLAAHRSTPSQRLDAATVEQAAISLIVDLCGAGASQSSTNVRVVEDHLRQFARTLATEPHQHGGKGA